MTNLCLDLTSNDSRKGELFNPSWHLIADNIPIYKVESVDEKLLGRHDFSSFNLNIFRHSKNKSSGVLMHDDQKCLVFWIIYHLRFSVVFKWQEHARLCGIQSLYSQNENDNRLSVLSCKVSKKQNWKLNLSYLSDFLVVKSGIA